MYIYLCILNIGANLDVNITSYSLLQVQTSLMCICVANTYNYMLFGYYIIVVIVVLINNITLLNIIEFNLQ